MISAERPDWHARAACRGVGTDLFFPEHSAPVPEAMAYCDRCDVRSECLAHALAFETEGIWAGIRNARQLSVLRHRAGVTRIDLQAEPAPATTDHEEIA